MGIASVDFDVRGQLLIRYSAMLILEKNGSTKGQYISRLQFSSQLINQSWKYTAQHCH
jgi:hypothetical protein